jgi:hypothetical protein
MFPTVAQSIQEFTKNSRLNRRGRSGRSALRAVAVKQPFLPPELTASSRSEQRSLRTLRLNCIWLFFVNSVYPLRLRGKP